MATQKKPKARKGKRQTSQRVSSKGGKLLALLKAHRLYLYAPSPARNGWVFVRNATSEVKSVLGSVLSQDEQKGPQ